MVSPSAILARLRRLAAGVRTVPDDLQALRSELTRLSALIDGLAEEHRTLRQHMVDEQGRRLDGLGASAERLERRLADDSVVSRTRHDELLTGLKRVHADESWHRRHLRALRTTEEYQLAFTDPEPLVSVVIATYERLERLREKVIPSILAQEYRNVEIVIVGDNSEYGEEAVTAGFEGAPIRFSNLPMRGPYSDDRQKLWMVAGTPPLNEAFHLARGRWLAPFSDDDIMRPNQIRVLLERARERRLEVVYGKIFDHHLDRPLGVFPPRWGDVALQAAVVHASLRFFEFELSDADFHTPNDMGMLDRLLRAGVRFGMVDEIVADYYPSLRGQWTPAQGADQGALSGNPD
jgi:hypothetical protein